MTSLSQPMLSAATGQRKFARARVHLPAKLVLFTGTSQCVLIDLSCGGVRITAGVPPRVGAMAVIECQTLELFGTVKWLSEHTCGIHFDELIPIETVISMRHTADRYAGDARRDVIEHARLWAQGRR